MSATPLPDSAQRVADWLAKAGHDQPVVMLPESGRTSADAAAGLGCSIAEIAKSIVFRCLADDTAVMVVASGIVRIDERKLAAHVGALGKASPDFVREQTGYVIGGVCPVGHARPVRVLLEQSLQGLAHVWAAAGHPHAVFRLTPTQLQALTGAPFLDLAQEVTA